MLIAADAARLAAEKAPDYETPQHTDGGVSKGFWSLDHNIKMHVAPGGYIPVYPVDTTGTKLVLSAPWQGCVELSD
jgi:hypothetical protein